MRAVVGEDQVLMREGISLVLGRAGFEVVAAAADAEELEREALAHEPDLVVADIRMPPGNADDGLRAALRLRAASPNIAVLVLSHYVQRTYAAELLEAGPGRIGYLLKQRLGDVESFCADVQRICGGGTVLDPEVVSAMLDRARREHGIARLTPRQREVLVLMAEGRSNVAIAHSLVLTEKAVVKHVSHIYDELGLEQSAEDHRRVLAVLRYVAAA